MHPLIITWLVLGVAILLLLSDRLRPDLVALMVIVTLGVTGVLTPQESFSGFSRSAVITLLAVFILAEGLQRTGVTDRVGVLLVKAAGRSEGRLTITVMLAGAFLCSPPTTWSSAVCSAITAWTVTACWILLHWGCRSSCVG
jgi:di/tricarboxylate transporter